jgi:phospholipid transport system substrate-binding protein
MRHTARAAAADVRIPFLRLLVAGFALLTLAFATLSSAEAGVERDLIAGLAGEAEPVLNDKSIAPAERTQKLRSILGSVFDSKQMAQSMLGRYWRRANDSQRAELVGLMETYLIDVYAGRMDSIDGQVKFDVGAEKQVGARTIVDSQVLRPGSPPVSVDWQVETVGGKAVVTDIVVEGVSLVVSQRADFASIIRSQGGLDGLIKLLKQKTGG